jgi:hypothetical protein
MKLLIACVCMAVGVAGAEAQDFCSLIVQVVSPEGTPVDRIPVTVEEKDGHTESGSTEKGEMRFCGLGVSPVTVTAGASHHCNYTIVRNVPLAWMVTRKLKIVFDEAVCHVDEPPPILLCAVLFRFVDQEGNRMAGVTFNPPPSRSPGLKSDAFGRAMVRLANREEFHSTAARPGLRPEAIDVECSSNLTERERTVVLRRLP